MDIQGGRQIVEVEQRQIGVTVLDLAEIRLCETGSQAERLLLQISLFTQPCDIGTDELPDIHPVLSWNYPPEFIRSSEYGIGPLPRSHGRMIAMSRSHQSAPDKGAFAPVRPEVADAAPEVIAITEYDQRHFSTYAQLVFADDAGEDWRQSAAEILGLDVDGDEEAAHRCWESHSKRAHWIATEGYQLLLVQAGLVKAN